LTSLVKAEWLVMCLSWSAICPGFPSPKTYTDCARQRRRTSHQSQR